MKQGIWLTIASALLFGSVTAFSKLLIADVPPATLGALTFFGAGLIGMWAMKYPDAKHLPVEAEKQHLTFIMAVILGAISAPLLLMEGLQDTSAPFASILTNIEAIASAGLAWLFFKERSDRASVFGVMIILSGVAIFTLADGIDMTPGSGWSLVAAAYLCWAIDVNLMKRVSYITPAQATAMRGMIGALVMGVIAYMRKETLPDGVSLLAGVVVGALGFGVSFILMLKALRLIGTPKTSAIFASAPVFGYVVSTLTENGRLSASGFQWASIGLIAIGVLLSGGGAFGMKKS